MSNSNIFSGLESLGFNNIKNVDLYDLEKKEGVGNKNSAMLKKAENDYFYSKSISCPVCDNKFKQLAIKSKFYRMDKMDSDFFIRYKNINPYFYDVWVCTKCGYSSMKSDFLKIKEIQKDSVLTKITPKWKSRQYPETYNIDIAIERFKLSLLNFYVINSKASSKAMNCLKIAWMYRLKEDTNNENQFLQQALNGFEKAFFEESFPIYGMDKFSCMYLIGELNRRLGNLDASLPWFSKVVTTPGVRSRLKNLARDQKDLVKKTKISV